MGNDGPPEEEPSYTDFSDEILHLLLNFNDTLGEPLPLDDSPAEENEATSLPVDRVAADEGGKRPLENSVEVGSASGPVEPTHLPESEPNTSTGDNHLAMVPVEPQQQAEQPADGVPYWAVFSGSDCRSCFLLRETVHKSDSGTITMGIHGGLGVFYHAMLEVVNVAEGTVHHYLADFRSCSLRAVKEFLAEQARLRKQEGMTLATSSINEFQDTLCTGMASIALRTNNLDSNQPSL